MKTVIATIALSLISAVSLAKSVDSVNTQAVVNTERGTLDPDYANFKSTKTRADVIAELKAAPALPAYTDGLAYEMAQNHFMSTKTREQVRAEAQMARRLDKGPDSLYRN
jgi:hypothetical protein